MSLARVRLCEGQYEHYLQVEGVGVIPGDDQGDFIGPLEVARPAGLTSLRHALIKHAGTTSPPPRRFVHPETGETFLLEVPAVPFRTRVQLVDISAEKFAQRHSYEFVPEPVALVIREGGAIAVLVQFVIEAEDEPDEEALRRLLKPLLGHTGSAVEHIDISPEGPYDFRTRDVVTSPDFWIIGVYITVPTRGRDIEFP